jgi:hypothetical protein
MMHVDTCYAMLEFIVTVTALLVVLMFSALVEFVMTPGWQEVHASEVYLVSQLPLTCFIVHSRAHAHARTHTQTYTHVSGNRSLLHALQWHVARIRELWRDASL